MLNWTPFGLHARTWGVFLSAITLGACLFALVCRRRQSIAAPGLSWVGMVGLTFRQGMLLGLAVVVICGAIVVSVAGVDGQTSPGFTQLWILPAGGAKPEIAVRVGVNNMESTVMEYPFDVAVDSSMVKIWPSIDLQPNGKWEATFALPSTKHSSSLRVETRLYRANAPRSIVMLCYGLGSEGK